MDNLSGMNMEQTAGDAPFGYMAYGGGLQTDYAVEGAASQEGFFENAGVLEYSPFEDGMQMDEPQAGYAKDGGFMGMENLPIAPAKALGQTEDQFMGYAEMSVGEAAQGGTYHLKTEAAVPETDSFEKLEPNDGCMAESGQEPESNSSDTGEYNAAENAMGDRERMEHEASEAARKAEWEAGRQAKKEAEQEQLARIDSMEDGDAITEAMKRISADMEKLTRRNMKDCVSEYVQTLCMEEPTFARLAMHPRKTMINCFRYINRKAREYVEQEMKDNGIKPEKGVYGSDVPDDLCYQWAEDYFRDMDAKEDRVEEEKFTPKPYSGKASTKTKNQKAEGKKGAAKKSADKKAEKPKREADGQISFMDQMMPGSNLEPEVKAG